ncbi:MAG TPA: hypothetical protein PKE16_05775 [Hyphomicrobium sp.]|nr:hypothetical protein [Hyphomicrobium sp.]
MAYQGIEFTHGSTAHRPDRNKSSTRKIAYNLLAVSALMIAAGVISSAYRPSDSAGPNARFESMGLKHVPTTFRGAPPV